MSTRLSRVECRYGTPRGAKNIRPWLLAAIGNVQWAIYIRDKLHDLDFYYSDLRFHWTI